ncbi:MAG: cytochrome c-type biogenesis CcmF C-terminal domain-containing protein, partial [Acidimicrobiales bacterium]
SAVRQLALATRRQGLRGMVGRANGGMVVHIGTIMIAVAFAASSAFIRQGEFTLKENQKAVIAGHTVEYLGPRTIDQDNRVELVTRIRVDGDRIFEPRLNKYRLTGQTIGTPSVRVGPREDVFLALTSAPDSDSDGAIGLRVIVQPLIMWLWVGGFVMVIGTALSLFPGRRRDPLTPVSSPVASGRPARGEGDGRAGDDAAGDRSDDDRGREPEPAPVAT